MIYLQPLIGTVVTIKSIWGNEYVGTLTGYVHADATIMVTRPMTVVTENDSVMLVPFTVTGVDDAVHLHLNTVFAVVPTNSAVSDSYLKIIADK